MGSPADFSISVTPTEVYVRHTPSESRPHGKLLGLLTSIGLVLFTIAFVVLMPSRGGDPSLLSYMLTPQDELLKVTFPRLLLLGITVVVIWRRCLYVRAAYPSDETFRCNSHEITVTRVPWFDFTNRSWRTYTFPLTDVSRVRYAPISSVRGCYCEGIRFLAHGRRWVLPGLSVKDASAVLTAMKGLGADVPDDPRLQRGLKAVAAWEDGNTSWMDRSWMDHDPPTTAATPPTTSAHKDN